MFKGMGVTSNDELWDAFERSRSLGADLAAQAWAREFTSPIGNYLWFVADLADLARNDPIGTQQLYEWHASFAANQEGYVGNMAVVYETLRHHDLARYQCDTYEVHEELMGVGHALHRRWRVVGYPPDYIERNLRAVCNVLHVPFGVATPGILEVLEHRDALAD
jgi:hypothetical protein